MPGPNGLPLGGPAGPPGNPPPYATRPGMQGMQGQGPPLGYAGYAVNHTFTTGFANTKYKC